MEISGEILVYAYKLDHGIDCYGYRICDPPRWNVIPSKLPKDFPPQAIGDLKDKGTVEFKGKRIFLQEVAVPKKTQIFSYIMDTKMCDTTYKIAKKMPIFWCVNPLIFQQKRTLLKITIT